MAAQQPQPKDLPVDSKYDHYDFPTSAPTPQAGHPGYTTPEQDAQVFQLRKLLEDAGCKERLDTLTLLRFLRARKFNVEASKAMCVLYFSTLDVMKKKKTMKMTMADGCPAGF